MLAWFICFTSVITALHVLISADHKTNCLISGMVNEWSHVHWLMVIINISVCRLLTETEPVAYNLISMNITLYVLNNDDSTNITQVFHYQKFFMFTWLYLNFYIQSLIPNWRKSVRIMNGYRVVSAMSVSHCGVLYLIALLLHRGTVCCTCSFNLQWLIFWMQVSVS